MALIIEDGTIVAGADSFATVQELRDYAAKRGIDVPALEADVEVLLIKAMDYLSAQEGRFKGWRVSDEQALSWPRRSVMVWGRLLPFSSIPKMIIEGQIALALAAISFELMPTIDPSQTNIKRDKTGPLETEFFSAQEGGRLTATFTAADALLAPFYMGGAFGVRVGRA